MGFHVKKLPYKKGPGWKLQLISYVGGRKITDIPKERWLSHGFSPSLSPDEAKALASSLNRISERKRQAERTNNIHARLEVEDDALNAYFPAPLLREFEEKILMGREALKDAEELAQEKRVSHWRAAKKTIKAVKLDYSNWAEMRFKFYDYFAKNNVSYSYVQKITRLINEWGQFCAKRQRLYFEALPLPTGKEKERINDRYFDENGQGKRSDPITPKMLDSVKSKMKPEQWNWLCFTVWFGLRPGEADGLADAKCTEVLYDDELDVPVLKIYQPKLTAIPRNQRYKFIPCHFKEQKEALELLKTGAFDRPLRSTIHDYFSVTVNLYGGRKGFEKMMLDKGELFENISSQMGHTTVDRTWGDYRNRTAVRYRKAS